MAPTRPDTTMTSSCRSLPASYRTESGDLAAAGRHVTACVEKELDLQRLTSIHSWLWVEGRVFLKPIPRFLLEPRFWTEYLCCAHGCACSLDENAVFRGTAQQCKRQGLRQRALGFLCSYAALISYESDFRIAQEKHLLPPEVLWPAWRMFVEQLDVEHIYPDVDPRFYHGELRLSRLNKIYILSQTPLRGYMPRWNQYGTFFHDNFAWLASATVYIAIVLAAMQVGLATESLAGNDTFQFMSYGFTVFSILGPLIAASLIILVFCWLIEKLDSGLIDTLSNGY
ncbi:hypothetical protein DL768_010173 [Monosporascus sp. mg162]|nr:hypothetical protein DL768_010173 [Monosporascus sp. mg162]